MWRTKKPAAKVRSRLPGFFVFTGNSNALIINFTLGLLTLCIAAIKMIFVEGKIKRNIFCSFGLKYRFREFL
jgi:hypothetical protein